MPDGTVLMINLAVGIRSFTSADQNSHLPYHNKVPREETLKIEVFKVYSQVAGTTPSGWADKQSGRRSPLPVFSRGVLVFYHILHLLIFPFFLLFLPQFHFQPFFPQLPIWTNPVIQPLKICQSLEEFSFFFFAIKILVWSTDSIHVQGT